MKLPQEIINRMHIEDITLVLKDCPYCGNGTKPIFHNIPSLPSLVGIACPNVICRFMRGQTLIYGSIYECGEAWDNCVASYYNRDNSLTGYSSSI